MQPERILRHLHRVFDKQPGTETALVVTSDAPELVWTIAGHQLTLTPTAHTLIGFDDAGVDWSDAGVDWGTSDWYAGSLVIDLTQYTIGGLAAHIGAQPGYSVDYTAHAAISARALVDGTASSLESNGSHLRIATRALWALAGAYASELDAAEAQIAEALVQLILPQAEGEWADLWGSYYGVARLDGEADGPYTLRILREVLRPRLNRYALENILEEDTGAPATIFEPWLQLFRLDDIDSTLSGSHKLHDGRYWAYATIDVHSPVSLDQTRPLIARNKAAGVLDYYTRPLSDGTVLDGRADGHDAIVAVFGASHTHYLLSRADVLVLSVSPPALSDLNPNLSGPRVTWTEWLAAIEAQADARHYSYTVDGVPVTALYTATGLLLPGPYEKPFQQTVYALADQTAVDADLSLTLRAGHVWSIDTLDTASYTDMDAMVHLYDPMIVPVDFVYSDALLLD